MYTPDQFTFVRLFEQMQEGIHETAKEKGFYETPPSDIERIGLMHEELGDATKAVRALEMPADEHCPMFSRLEIKLADTIIRIMDYAQYRNLRVVQAVLAKIEANKLRPYKHGKKL